MALWSMTLILFLSSIFEFVSIAVKEEDEDRDLEEGAYIIVQWVWGGGSS